MKKNLILIGVAGLLMLGGCQMVKKSQRYPNLYAEKSKTILVMPPINKSVNVGAKEQFYSSLIVPITQNGYYVLPPLLTMEILKEESAYDAEMFLNNSMKPVGNLFGVDAVLFTTIHNWEKSTLFNNITVKVEYMMKSTRTDSVLFHRVGTIVYSSQMNSGNIFADLIGQMLITALQKEIEVGRKCNTYTFEDIPRGPYSPNFGIDSIQPAQPKVFNARISN